MRSVPSKSDPTCMKLLQNTKVKIVPERVTKNAEKGDACDVVKAGCRRCGKASLESFRLPQLGRPETG